MLLVIFSSQQELDLVRDEEEWLFPMISEIAEHLKEPEFKEKYENEGFNTLENLSYLFNTINKVKDKDLIEKYDLDYFVEFLNNYIKTQKKIIENQ